MSKRVSQRFLRREKKRKRIRKKLAGTGQRPRLAVYRSAKNIYAQLIDDAKQVTLAGASTLTPSLVDNVKKSDSKIDAAKLVGKAIGEKAKGLKIESVIFDRGGYLFHGRVKAVADGARESGLKF